MPELSSFHPRLVLQWLYDVDGWIWDVSNFARYYHPTEVPVEEAWMALKEVRIPQAMYGTMRREQLAYRALIERTRMMAQWLLESEVRLAEARRAARESDLPTGTSTPTVGGTDSSGPGPE